MKKRTITVFVFLNLILSLVANTTDSISTVYSGGEFVTRCQQRVLLTNNVGSEVADYLVSDFHNSPDHLFSWALKNLGLQNKNNELIIVYKSSVHDYITGITHGVFDIVVPGITTLRNIKVDAIVTKKNYTSGVVKVTANIVQSTMLLKHAVATMLIVPQVDNSFVLETNVKLKFGWFFNLFITQKRYKSIVEWRIKKFSENIIDECKSRE